MFGPDLDNAPSFYISDPNSPDPFLTKTAQFTYYKTPYGMDHQDPTLSKEATSIGKYAVTKWGKTIPSEQYAIYRFQEEGFGVLDVEVFINSANKDTIEKILSSIQLKND